MFCIDPISVAIYHGDFLEDCTMNFELGWASSSKISIAAVSKLSETGLNDKIVPKQPKDVLRGHGKNQDNCAYNLLYSGSILNFMEWSGWEGNRCLNPDKVLSLENWNFENANQPK